MSNAGRDLGELIRAATERLAAAGVPSARVDAGWLAEHTIGLTRRDVLAGSGPVSADLVARYWTAVEERAQRTPIQHLLGTAPFRRLSVPVGPGVFIPRPETELLVEAVLPRLAELPKPVVVDLCSGSGAIALSIAQEVPAARVVAVECAPPALEWLHRNVAGTGVEVWAEDVTRPNPARGTAWADVVLSNPPYVPLDTDVAPEVRADPAQAVFAGSDGLAVIPGVLARAAEWLRSGGLLAVEHDDSHGELVPAMLASDGRWRAISEHADLAGRARYAVAERV